MVTTPIAYTADGAGSVARTVAVANAAAAGAQPLAYTAALAFSGTNSPRGPDQAGYAFRTSADPGGPAFVWTDIAATGTPVAFTGGTDDGYSGVQTLPFTFPFYGTNYTTARIFTNGFLSFVTGPTTASATTYGHGFPTAGGRAPSSPRSGPTSTPSPCAR